MGYYCRKCGRSFSNLQTLVNCGCAKGGRCEPYEGKETGPFHCRKCGRSFSNLQVLVNCGCAKGGRCEAI